jgi:hypothetical protein
MRRNKLIGWMQVEMKSGEFYQTAAQFLMVENTQGMQRLTPISECPRRHRDLHWLKP